MIGGAVEAGSTVVVFGMAVVGGMVGSLVAAAAAATVGLLLVGRDLVGMAVADNFVVLDWAVGSIAVVVTLVAVAAASPGGSFELVLAQMAQVTDNTAVEEILDADMIHLLARVRSRLVARCQSERLWGKRCGVQENEGREPDCSILARPLRLYS